MHIYLDQIGCRLNYSEMETLAAQLRTAGHRIVANPAAAQVIVFNSCAVTADAARTSRKRVRSLHGANPNAKIVLTGCWATLAPVEAANLPGIKLVADNQQKELLPVLLEPWSAELEEPDELLLMQPASTPFLEPAQWQAEQMARARTRAFVKVQDGCNNKCTFCIVTVARGESRSRQLTDLVNEVQQFVEQGGQEAVLTGVHLGSYGRDLAAASDLKTLVSALLADTDITRLRLSSLEPWELADGFFDLWQQWPGRLCPHLHLPLQAGTDRQLRRMARRCTTASFAQLVQAARAAIPDLILTTDLIVGFPGETDADFAAGLAFVEAMRFAGAHVFPYSARTGTAAASFPNQVPSTVKKARAQTLRNLVDRTGQTERSRFVGTVRPVLWEGAGQPLLDQPGLLWSGLTDNYLRVQAVAPGDLDLHGKMMPVLINEVLGDALYGTIC